MEIETILHCIREVSQAYQLPMLDLTIPPPPGGKAVKRRVDSIQTELRRLHEDLNAALYTCKASERPKISSSTDVYDLLRSFMEHLDHEELWIVLLNTRNSVLRLVKLYQGSVNSSQVRVGECFQQAIVDKASAVIIAHNHPSGDPCPSPEDCALTRAIVQGGKLLDIDVLDHLVIGENRFVSLKERGLGFD